MSDLTLSENETQALQEVASILAEDSSVVLSTLLDKKIEIKVEGSGAADPDALGAEFPESIVIVDCQFASGFEAMLSFLYNKPLVAKLSDLIMMGDGTAEFSEDHLDAIQEATNQMLGAGATSLSGRLDKTVDFQPSTAKESSLADAGLDFSQLMAIEYQIDIEGETEGKIGMLVSYPVIQEMAAALAEGGEEEAAGEGGEPDIGVAEEGGVPGELDLSGLGGDDMAAAEFVGAAVSTAGPSDMSATERARLELLLDVKLDVSIELGRSRMIVRDILELGAGSVIELDKMAGEAVDLLINDKKLAEGEVVVVDENFGIRITHLVSMEERIKMLQKT
ncbi:MAG: flagellar motor switch protein FliN [Gemmatimonadota bacterium]|nr:flagellar motor switch protein FliN [Gemmatimonadota bacterium]